MAIFGPYREYRCVDEPKDEFYIEHNEGSKTMGIEIVHYMHHDGVESLAFTLSHDDAKDLLKFLQEALADGVPDDD